MHRHALLLHLFLLQKKKTEEFHIPYVFLAYLKGLVSSRVNYIYGYWNIYVELSFLMLQNIIIFEYLIYCLFCCQKKKEDILFILAQKCLMVYHMMSQPIFLTVFFSEFHRFLFVYIGVCSCGSVKILKILNKVQ